MKAVSHLSAAARKSKTLIASAGDAINSTASASPGVHSGDLAEELIGTDTGELPRVLEVLALDVRRGLVAVDADAVEVELQRICAGVETGRRSI